MESDSSLKKGPVVRVNPNDFMQPCADGRFWHIDFARIVAVAFVAVDHGNQAFGVWNNLFAMNWVLQVLCIVSGMSFTMSRISLWRYEGRLFGYLVIGVATNWAAWVITGQDWRHNVPNVVFQLMFIVAMMLYSAILAPLKPFLWKARLGGLRGGKPTSPWTIGVMFASIMIVTLIFCNLANVTATMIAPSLDFLSRSSDFLKFWGVPLTVEETVVYLRESSLFFVTPICSALIVMVFPLFVKETSWLTWFVLFNVYWSRLVFYRSAAERLFHCFDLFFIGMVCSYTGIKGRETMGKHVARYWFLVPLLCGAIWYPGSFGRFDEMPLRSFDARARMTVIEIILVMTFLLAGERFVDRKIFTEDNMGFMNTWSLLAYVTHKAIHITIVSPLNWVLIFLVLPVVCWLSSRKQMPSKNPCVDAKS